MTETSAKIRIVTDTTASLPPGYAQAHVVEVVPQAALLGPRGWLCSAVSAPRSADGSHE